MLCVISRKTAADDAECQVKANGGEIGRVPAGGRGAFNVAVGTHQIEVGVVGGSANRWDGPVARPVTFFGGATTFFTGRFNLRPSAPAPVPVVASGRRRHKRRL